MRKPESYQKEIERLRVRHSNNFRAESFHLNDTIRGKIIKAWEGYHAACKQTLAKGKP